MEISKLLCIFLTLYGSLTSIFLEYWRVTEVWTVKLISSSVCGIEMNDKFGGSYNEKKVAEFTEAGAFTYEKFEDGLLMMTETQ